MYVHLRRRLRGQKRAARTDHHVKTTVAHCLPHVKVFAQGQAAVHDCDSPGEAFRKPAYGLRRERYLRYENDRSLPEGHRLIQRSQVYLRLAAACDAVEQEPRRLSRSACLQRPGYRPRGRLLRRRQPGRRAMGKLAPSQRVAQQ